MENATEAEFLRAEELAARAPEDMTLAEAVELDVDDINGCLERIEARVERLAGKIEELRGLLVFAGLLVAERLRDEGDQVSGGTLDA